MGKHPVDPEIRKDLIWWKQFMQKYNGISILWLQDTLQANVTMATDLCLTGAGGICGNEFYHAKFTSSIKQQYKNIAHLELIAIIIAVKLWYQQIRGKVVYLSCDSMACVEVVNAGKARDPQLQNCLRELSMLLARNETWLKLVYVTSKQNKIPDLLSRWYNTSEARREFRRITHGRLIRRSVTQNIFQFYNW